MADMTPDFAPIMGSTPCEGFFLDAGWGTYGFKATPICGKTMSHTVATGTNHPLITGFSLQRFARLELTGEKGAAAVGHARQPVGRRAAAPAVRPGHDSRAGAAGAR
jgi:sarcosine oxidase subunit beta